MNTFTFHYLRAFHVGVQKAANFIDDYKPFAAGNEALSGRLAGGIPGAAAGAVGGGLVGGGLGAIHGIMDDPGEPDPQTGKRQRGNWAQRGIVDGLKGVLMGGAVGGVAGGASGAYYGQKIVTPGILDLKKQLEGTISSAPAGNKGLAQRGVGNAIKKTVSELTMGDIGGATGDIMSDISGRLAESGIDPKSPEARAFVENYFSKELLKDGRNFNLQSVPREAWTRSGIPGIGNMYDLASAGGVSVPLSDSVIPFPSTNIGHYAKGTLPPGVEGPTGDVGGNIPEDLARILGVYSNLSEERRNRIGGNMTSGATDEIRKGLGTLGGVLGAGGKAVKGAGENAIRGETPRGAAGAAGEAVKGILRR